MGLREPSVRLSNHPSVYSAFNKRSELHQHIGLLDPPYDLRGDLSGKDARPTEASMSRGSTERELVESAVAGDRTALDQLLLLHYMSVFRHVGAELPRRFEGLLSCEDILHQANGRPHFPGCAVAAMMLP